MVLPFNTLNDSVPICRPFSAKAEPHPYCKYNACSGEIHFNEDGLDPSDLRLSRVRTVA